MFTRQTMPRTPLPSLALDLLSEFDVRSIYDPFMGTGLNLYAFKRAGLKVVGSDVLESAWHASRGLIENNRIRLSDSEIASFTSATPPDLAEFNRFAAWVEKGLFDKVQAGWLGYWRERFDRLEGYAQDLALVAVGWMIDNWLKPLEQPGVSASSAGIMPHLLKRANQWVWDNGQTNQILRGGPLQVAQGVSSDACYLYLDPPLVSVDLRSWLNEAWFQGASEADMGAFYHENPFYSSLEEYRDGVMAMFEQLDHIPLWAVQYRSEELDAIWGEQPTWLLGRELRIQQCIGMGAGVAGERLCILARS